MNEKNVPFFSSEMIFFEKFDISKLVKCFRG